MIVNEVDKIRAEINSELQAMEAERMQLYEHPGSNIDPSKLLLNVSYPYSDVWDYDTSLVNLNLIGFPSVESNIFFEKFSLSS